MTKPPPIPGGGPYFFRKSEYNKHNTKGAPRFMNSEQIEQNIREVNGSLAMEGMTLTKKEIEELRAVMRGEVSYRKMKKKILMDYQTWI